MGSMSISHKPTPTPPKTPAPPVPKADKSASVSPVKSTGKPTETQGPKSVAKVGPPPNYPAPKPPSKTVDVSSQNRPGELANIHNPQIAPRPVQNTLSDLASSQDVRNGGNLTRAMADPKFGKIMEKFSPSMGQRFLQAFGKSKGSVDGGRFKKNMGRMLPLVNIGVYGKDAVRAHKMKNALNGIADHAKTNNNQLAQQIASSLGAHEKSKRNTQAISGAVSVASTAVAFVPGTQIAPALTGASASLASSVGGHLGSLGVHYTAAAAIDSTLKTVGSTAVSTGASYAQDYAVTGGERSGERLGKVKMGSGYGKLKVSSRMEDGEVKVQTEMGYQAARSLVNYLGPAQGKDEPANSARMELRKALGATDPTRTYQVSDDKKAARAEATKMAPHDQRTDYLQMFFDVGVKGASMPYED